MNGSEVGLAERIETGRYSVVAPIADTAKLEMPDQSEGKPAKVTIIIKYDEIRKIATKKRIDPNNSYTASLHSISSTLPQYPSQYLWMSVRAWH